MRWGADPDRPTARTRRRGGGRSGLAGLHIRRGGDRWRGDHVSGIVVEHQPDEHLSGRHVDIQPGNIQWRISFMGLFTAYLTTPLLAIVLSMALAYVLGHKAALRFLSVFCFLGLVVITVAMGLFALDAIQLRGGVPEENRSAFSIGSILTELKFLSVFLVLVFLGWGGWKTAGNIPGKPKSSERAERTAEVLKAQKREG